MDGHFGGQFELHDVVVHELLEPFVDHALAVGMVFVLDDEPGKGGQVGVRVRLFIEVFFDDVGLQVVFLFEEDAQVLRHFVVVEIAHQLAAEKIPAAVVHQYISEGGDFLEKLVAVIIAAVRARAEDAHDALLPHFGGGVNGGIGVFLHIYLCIREKVPEDLLEPAAHAVGATAGPVEMEPLDFGSVAGQLEVVREPLFDDLPRQHLGAQAQGLGHENLFPFFV